MLKHLRKIDHTYSEFICDCGNIKIIRRGDVNRDDGKATVTCGLCNRHLMSKSTEYSIWVGIKQRCLNPKEKAFNNYGGRGIKICNRWLNSFENFYEDMGKRPDKNYSIERIDNNGNYCKENCKWATQKEQCRNKRTNYYITFNGKTQTAIDWSKEVKISSQVIRDRIKYNWSIEEALTIPPQKFNYSQIEFNGKKQTLTAWSKELDLPIATLHRRINKYGWSIEKAFTTGRTYEKRI